MTWDFDIVICGGGLAGLTLARQLQLTIPGLSIAVIDKTSRPLPAAAHKVGESSVEISAHYFSRVLGLEDYLSKAQLPKLGLRFFFGDTRGPVENRPEFGAQEFPPAQSYQLDRGTFEDDLRQIDQQEGITMLEGYWVEDIKLSADHQPHRVVCQKRGTPTTHILKSRWVVDAMGRRRLLQSRLNLGLPNGHQASAVWFRMPGRLDVSDLVPDSCTQWHSRVPDRARYYSTNHLMGRGYWVWFIPLSSGNTSVGIVTGEADHPYSSYSTPEKAMRWLRTYEPKVADYLEGRQMLDFKGLKNYSYGSRQVFSSDRWACVGEAGLFADPLYSPGSDMIAFGNTLTTEMIKLDLAGRLRPEIVKSFNALYLNTADSFFDLYRNGYPLMGTAQIMTEKVLWDFGLYWALTAQIFFQNLFQHHDLLGEVSRIGFRYTVQNKRVQRLLREWDGKTTNKNPYEFMNPFQYPLLRTLHEDLQTQKSPDEALEDLSANCELLEQWAESLHQQAQSDVGRGPEKRFERVRDLIDVLDQPCVQRVMA
jgi:flavin-dependent dehydrogenase